MADHHPTPRPEPATRRRRAAPGREDPCAPLLRSLADPAWVKDPEGRYLAVNEAFARTLGRGAPPESFVGRTDPEVLSAPLPEEYRSQDARVIRAGAVVRGEVEVPRADGTSLRLAVTRSPYRDDSGRAVGLVGIARALDPAEPAAALPGQLSRLAHELSNPLNTILSLAELMRMDPRPPEDDEALRTVEREAERAAELVERLRRLARGAGAPPAPRPEAPREAETGALEILVVDDESCLRSAIQRFLERRGHRVDAAADGSEALALLEARSGRPPYDAILCDLSMPGLGGEQLLDRLRRRGDGLHRRVVFMTGDAARVPERALRPALLKPVQLPEVARVVEALGADERWRAGSASSG